MAGPYHVHISLYLWQVCVWHGDSEQTLLDKLVKLNVETKEFVTWEESGGFVSEPVFVKAPDGKGEDGAVVLSCVINVND